MAKSLKDLMHYLSLYFVGSGLSLAAAEERVIYL